MHHFVTQIRVGFLRSVHVYFPLPWTGDDDSMSPDESSFGCSAWIEPDGHGGGSHFTLQNFGEIGSLEQGLRQNRLRLSSVLIAPLMKDDHTFGLKALVQDLVQCLPIAEVPTWKCGDEAKSDDYARRNAWPF